MAFKPKWTCTTGEEVEVGKDDRTRIFMVKKFRHENVQCCTEGVECVVADIFCKDKDGEGEREGEVGEGGVEGDTG